MINKNINIIRVFALISVLIYHISVIIQFSFENQFSFLNRIMSLGGEIGVTIFFIISGYCIYFSIDNEINKKDKFDFKKFILKRLKRIYPEYIFSILFLVVFTTSIVYFTPSFKDIISHVFLVHNFSLQTHGSISGVLWTMGVIFQFYLISYCLYKLVKKSPILFLFICIMISILLKFYLFHYVIPSNSTGIIYMVYGRQIFTSLDNFVIGMFIAFLSKFYNGRNNFRNITSLLTIFGVLIFYLYSLDFNGIYSDSILGYLFHTILAILLGVIIFIFSKIKIKNNNVLSKVLLLLSEYEYSIYIWHLIIIENFHRNSIWFQNLGVLNKFIFICFLSVIIGYFSNEIIAKSDYKKIFMETRYKIIGIIKK